MILVLGSASVRASRMRNASSTDAMPSAVGGANWPTSSDLVSFHDTIMPRATITVDTTRNPKKAARNQFDCTMLLSWATVTRNGSCGPDTDPDTTLSTPTGAWPCVLQKLPPHFCVRTTMATAHEL